MICIGLQCLGLVMLALFVTIGCLMYFCVVAHSNGVRQRWFDGRGRTLLRSKPIISHTDSTGDHVQDELVMAAHWYQTASTHCTDTCEIAHKSPLSQNFYQSAPVSDDKLTHDPPV